MNADIKAQWTAALRSDEFEQGKGKLQNDGKFCCLGVLSELGARAGVCQRKPDYPGSAVVRYGPTSEYLPPAVAEWAGLNSTNPSVSDPAHPGGVSLTWLNDIRGASFREIADVIDAQL